MPAWRLEVRRGMLFSFCGIYWLPCVRENDQRQIGSCSREIRRGQYVIQESQCAEGSAGTENIWLLKHACLFQMILTIISSFQKPSMKSPTKSLSYRSPTCGRRLTC